MLGSACATDANPDPWEGFNRGVFTFNEGLDIYVLDDTCDPYAGCLYGSTQSYAVDDEVTFECSQSLSR